MNLFNTKTDFSTLLPTVQSKVLFQQLGELLDNNAQKPLTSLIFEQDKPLEDLKTEWQELSTIRRRCAKEDLDNHLPQLLVDSSDQADSNWLIRLFNTLFAEQNVILARGTGEPEYFPANNNQPARIEFAHGFFQSALHELSHFCVAGQQRRLLPDFGYWYAPDGRSAAQQQAFERVEIKPQAIECLFTLACGRSFEVSQDNLFADFDTSGSTFAEDVYHQARNYLAKPETLPPDAKILLYALLRVCKTY